MNITLILISIFFGAMGFFTYYAIKLHKGNNTSIEYIRKLKNISMVLTVICGLIFLNYVVNGSWWCLAYIFNGSIWYWNYTLWGKNEKNVIIINQYKEEKKPIKEKKIELRRKKLRRIFNKN